jgi:hypothetical protein
MGFGLVDISIPPYPAVELDVSSLTIITDIRMMKET